MSKQILIQELKQLVYEILDKTNKKEHDIYSAKNIDYMLDKIFESSPTYTIRDFITQLKSLYSYYRRGRDFCIGFIRTHSVPIVVCALSIVGIALTLGVMNSVDSIQFSVNSYQAEFNKIKERYQRHLDILKNTKFSQDPDEFLKQLTEMQNYFERDKTDIIIFLKNKKELMEADLSEAKKYRGISIGGAILGSLGFVGACASAVATCGVSMVLYGVSAGLNVVGTGLNIANIVVSQSCVNKIEKILNEAEKMKNAIQVIHDDIKRISQVRHLPNGNTSSFNYFNNY